MALTFRGTKGSALTHDELDLNFREFFYSASVDGNILELHKSQSLAEPVRLPMPRSIGSDGYIQLKEGNGPSGSGEFVTASKDFKFDYTSSILYVTGTYKHLGDVDVQGDMLVNGILTAQQYNVSLVSSSISYSSGSNKFGDTADDSHDFIGRVLINGSHRLTGSATQLGDNTLTGNQTTIGNTTLNGNLTQTGTYVLSGSLNQSGSTSVNGDVSVTGTIDSLGQSSKIRFHFDNVASLPNPGTYHGMFAHTHAEGKAWFAHAGAWQEIATSASVATEITALSSSAASTYLMNTTDTLSGSLTILDNINVGTLQSNTHNITGSVNVTGSVTATQFTAINGVGTPTLTSANNIILSASNVVQVKDALFRVNSFNNTDTGSLTIADGDFYYNADQHSFFGVISGSHTAFGLASTGSGITDIVSDTSPQLGGTLDINTYNISGSGSINIDGSITATGDITAYYSSDSRLKDNVSVIGSALDKIDQIGGYEFDWNSDSEHSGHDIGVIAQEIEKVLPEVVVDRSNGYKAVRYDKIVALLIQAVKEQQLQIDELKSKL